MRHVLGIAAAAALTAFVLVSADPAAAQNKCAAAKVKAAGKKASNKAKCHSSAVKKGDPVDAACLTKAETKFNASFAKAEAKPPCLTTGDGAAIEAKIDAFIADLAGTLGGPGPSACSSAKYKEAGKKAYGKLGCHRKAAQKGVPVDPACLAKAETKYNAGFAKAEAKGDCVTTGDAAAIEAKVDAFIDDVLAELSLPCGPPPAPFASAKVVAGPGDLVKGPLARGVVGDVLLENDQIRAIIQQPGRVMFGIGTYGGNIIDADRRRSCGDERDSFEELAPLINVENTANYTNVTVLNDGTNNQPAVVRATGPDDLLDFINPSSTIANFGLMFPVDQDDRDLPIDVQTDYILAAGKSYIQVETTITNTGATPLDIYFGDIADGSGQVELFEPPNGFGEPLITDPCPSSTFQPCTAGTCDMCDFIAWSGEDLATGVSYGYVHGFNSSSNFNTSGVSVTILGRRILGVLIGSPSQAENFHMAAANSPGDAITITRYFAVGDGTVGAIEDIRNDIRGVSNTGTLTGVVSGPDGPIANADVAVIAPSFAGGPTLNVFDHFHTAADGSYSGTLPAGSYTVRANKDGRQFGTPDPANVVVSAGGTAVQNFSLPDHGTLSVVVTDENGDPIPAKIQLVGFDPSPDPLNHQTVLIISTTTGVFGSEVSDHDGLTYGISFVTFADRTGITGPLDVEPGSYQLVVSHGPRYSAFEQNVTITAGATTSVTAQIARVIDTPGFICGDFHVHSINSPDCEVTNEERVATMLAEGMDFFTPSDHDFRADFGPTIANMDVGDLISTAQSAEITTFDYGHFNSWPVTRDPLQLNGGGVDWGRAGIAPGMDFPSLGSYNLSPAEIYAAALADPRPNIIQINHMRSHFNTDGLDIDTAEGDTGPPTSHTPPLARRLDPSIPNLFDAGFDSLEVWIGTDGRTGDLQHFVGENLGDWFNMMNQGILRSGVADSDTHQKRTTQMNARNYIASAITDPSQLGSVANSDALAASVKDGKSIGTNAAFVTISATAASTGQSAGLGIGDNNMLATTDGNVSVTVTVKSPLWARYDRLEFYINNAPQRYDHDSDPTTRDRYRVIPNIVKNAPADFTVSQVNDFPAIPGAEHFETTYVLNLTGITDDSWLVVLVRGTDGVSPPLFPVLPNSIKQSTNTSLAQLTDGNLGEDGILALSFTNPIFIDANNDTVWTPPGVMITP
jgi:hypothetical protein